MIPPWLGARERAAIGAFAEAARARFGDRILDLRLFGSAARGDYVPDESDLDILVVVGEDDRALRDEIAGLACRVESETGLYALSPRVLPRDLLDHLRRRERRIALDIDREGIPL